MLAFRASLGLSWQAVVVATGLTTVPLSLLLSMTDLAGGRRRIQAGPAAVRSSMLTLPLVVLAVAIGCYVAGGTGISNWLVRFLAAAPSRAGPLAS